MKKSTPAVKAAKPAPVQLTCKMEPTQITVGDKVQLDCDGVLGVGSAVLNWQASFKSDDHTWALLSEPELVDSRLKVTATAYRPGQHPLSDISFTINGKELQLSSGGPLEVKSVLKPGTDGKMPTPYDIVAPGSIPYPLWWWIMWGLLSALAIGYITKVILKRRRELAALKAQGGPVKPLSEKEKYESSLRKLESSGLHARGEFKSFALSLTIIVKRALQSELGLKAEEMTTEELLEQLEKKYKKFFSRVGSELKILFMQLDQIKFAKITVHAEDCQKLLDLANRIGQELFPQPAQGGKT